LGWLVFALDTIVKSLARNTTTNSNLRDSPETVIWVQCPVLVESFPEVLLCPVFFAVGISLDHALLKRPAVDATRIESRLYVFGAEIEIIVWLLRVLLLLLEDYQALATLL